VLGIAPIDIIAVGTHVETISSIIIILRH